MSSQDLRFDGGTNSQESSDSEAESRSHFQAQSKSARINTKFCSWKFKDTIHADVSECEFEERKRQLIEHFRTRTTPDRPTSVLYVSIFADLHNFINASANETISIAIIGYVQTKQSRPYTMAKWIPSVTWEPVPGGLCNCSEFLEYTARANNEKSSWYNLPIFGDLGLNIQGRIAARKERKVSPRLFFTP